MRILKTALVGTSALALAAVAFAYQLAVKTESRNLVSQRIAGTWVLNKAESEALGLDTSTAKAALGFTSDATVLTRLQAQSDRFKSRQIFGAGMMSLDGKDHPYILVNDAGNMNLVYFVTRSGEVGAPTTTNISMAVSRGNKNDILILGGDVEKNEGAAIYKRSTRTTEAGGR